MTDVLGASGQSLHKLIKTQSLTFESIVQQRYQRYLEVENRVHAWVEVDFARALETARTLDCLPIPEFSSPLYGSVGGVKDIFNVEGFYNRMGSPIRETYFPGNDARCVFSLRRSGGIIAGKTATAEFAVHSLKTKHTQNPLNYDWQPGTSSSGSAAAVATGTVPWALATQTAGSISRPAAYCAVLGFKPTFGLVPRTGVLKTADTLDTVGFMARHVSDLYALLRGTARIGHDHPLNTINQNYDNRQNIQVTSITEGLNIFDSYSKRATQSYFRILNEISDLSNIAVTTECAPNSWSRIHSLHYDIYNWGLAYNLKLEWQQNQNLFSGELATLIESGRQISLHDYERALYSQQQEQLLASRAFSDNKFIITPTTAGFTPKLGETELPDLNAVVTLLGLPSICLPYQIPGDPTPLSLLIIGSPMGDVELLRLSERIQTEILSAFAVPSKYL